MTAALRAGERALTSNAPTSRRLRDAVFRGFLYLSIGLALGVLLLILVDVFVDGRSRLNWDLITQMPSRRPQNAGIQSAITGSLWVVGTTAVLSLPIGVAAAIYLEEFAHPGRWYNRLIEVNIQNLAAVPSVVFGILGLAFIVRSPLSLGNTVFAAALVLTMLVLPTVVIVSREAIRAVPGSLRQGSMALGATKWQTVRRQVLPSAFPGILTGSILSVSRALGESAPLIMLGALTFITKNPGTSPSDALGAPYTVLPLQIFKYTNEREALRPVAAAAIVVLLIVLLALNAVAILLRNRLQKRR